MNRQVIRLTSKWAADRLPKRPKNANKGTFGKVLVMAGSGNYPGAAYLACTASYRVGAGLVTLATTPEVKTIVSRKLPEATFLNFNEISQNISQYDVLLIGPGLGKNANIPKEVLNINKYKVLDADGLRFFSESKGEIILTPHPGEMARLTGLSIEKIQQNREDIAKSFAKKWNVVVVLKGANTVVASPAGGFLVSPFANPLLATAGTGDVLSGIIAGLLAQNLTAFDAAGLGVYIHAKAAEKLKIQLGKAGLLASDLLPVLPQILKELA